MLGEGLDMTSQRVSGAESQSKHFMLVHMGTPEGTRRVW